MNLVKRSIFVSNLLKTRYITVLLLVAADAAAIALCFSLSVFIRWKFNGQFEPEFYWKLWYLLPVFFIIYEVAGLYQGAALYPGVALGPAEELRRLTYATTGVYLLMMLLAFLLKVSASYSRLIWLGSWIATLIAVPLFRVGVRKIWTKWNIWGVPAVVLSSGGAAGRVVKTLLKHKEYGLRPVVVLDNDIANHGKRIEGVLVLGPWTSAQRVAKRRFIKHGIIAMKDTDWKHVREAAERYSEIFPHLTVIPDNRIFSSMWVTAQDVGGMLGLEIRQKLLLRSPMIFKRFLDILAVLVIGSALLPVFALISLLVKLSSSGPVFYGAKRIGRKGTVFTAWKFRTMVEDADIVLEKHLQKHPELHAEWNCKRKLKNDPRITGIGYLLRITSLDELPQFWNILIGEMSVVGPRPIVDNEVKLYGSDNFEIYRKVRPGLSGLWQVSGRSDTTYNERVELDVYYVRNWSVWLDFYILLKTIKAVFTCKGAY